MSPRTRRGVVTLLIAVLGGAVLAWSNGTFGGERATGVFAPWRVLARGLGRPFVLPFLWSRSIAAEERGELGAALHHFEDVLAWLPRWTDGQVLGAWRLATQRRDAAAPDLPADRARRLAMAIAWLDQRAETAPTAEDRAELWAACAFLLEVEGTRADVREVAAHTLGFDPVEGADDRLARAEAEQPTRTLIERRAFLAFSLIESALAAGEPGRARRMVAVGRRRLAGLPDNDSVRAAIRALDLLADWFERPGPDTRAEIEANPYLDGIVRHLPR